MLDIFRSSSKLLKTFCEHTDYVWNIDYSIFGSRYLLCSASYDNTVCVYDVENNKLIQSFNGHSNSVYCAKFSLYYYYKHHRNIICSSSNDKTIRFWDFENNQQFQVFNGHTAGVCGIEFSSFNGSRYLCSGSHDSTIRLWDIEASKSLHVFNGHEDGIWCVDISPLQSNSNNSNNIIGVIGGNGYTICSGSWDNTIRLWDIETTKQLIMLNEHKHTVWSVKYGSNELGIIGGANTILSGSSDKNICLCDIRSGKKIQVFKGHTSYVYAVEYSPFVVNNTEIGCSSNVICSGSIDNTIRFWDIRSNKSELHVINGNKDEENGILCIKFLQLKTTEKVIVIIPVVLICVMVHARAQFVFGDIIILNYIQYRNHASLYLLLHLVLYQYHNLIVHLVKMLHFLQDKIISIIVLVFYILSSLCLSIHLWFWYT
ncbi:WD repeat-containing protein [Reticulomyxa filosa]|uniref:WD repeat-containing protein n=1 Tax=Reticulomyxa filosa TaxID=46433 RepID=X6NF28_RETFI|nr:WD repeat-containing protein [Reticulomyxa filosa]|eukprot:ETO24900.1 WD repeat-containing protein [Reticulomyxa filosa]